MMLRTVSDTSFAGVKRDGLDTPTCAAGCDSMSEFMKRNHKHLAIVVRYRDTKPSAIVLGR